MPQPDTQAVVARLPARLLREVNRYIDEHPGYGSVSEFIAVAVANQLELEDGPGTPGIAAVAADSSSAELLRRPQAETPVLVEPQVVQHEPLFVLTNRLFPLKLSCRILANLQAVEGPVHVDRFQGEAASEARRLGLRLREEDRRNGRRGGDRRWVALPVGPDEHAAGSRFAQFFTLGLSGSGDPSGPLPQVGLAYPSADRACALTQLGWELAEAPNPILGESDEPGMLGSHERETLVRALHLNPAELASVREFAELVHRKAGRQAEVDAGLKLAHPGWNRERATAHRAAMVGRLRDLGVAEVEGRGPAGRIRLEADMHQLINGQEER